MTKMVYTQKDKLVNKARVNTKVFYCRINNDP